MRTSEQLGAREGTSQWRGGGERAPHRLWSFLAGVLGLGGVTGRQERVRGSGAVGRAALRQPGPDRRPPEP